MEDSMMDLLFVSDDGLTYGYDTNGDEIVDTLMGPMTRTTTRWSGR